jgi:glycosyltransferase involved in cell wall biosynthesis
MTPHSDAPSPAVAAGAGKSSQVWIVARAVSFDDGVGGLERAVADQARSLSELGWDVTLVAPPGGVGTLPERLALRTVAWPVGPFRPGRPGFAIAYWIWVLRVRRVIESELPSGASIYVHGAASGVLESLNFTNVGRVVANPHGMEEFRRAGILRELNRVPIRRLARGARRADRIIATDVGLVDAVMSNLHVDCAQVVTLPNAVDVARLDALASAGAGRAIEADFVTVGRLTPNKGYDLLLDALVQVRDDFDAPIRWVHFGRGAMRDQLLSSARGLKGLQLLIVDNADDAQVQASIDKATYFVQPSRYEGSSLTTLEGMARGITCIGTPVGGIPEKLIDGVTGFLAAEPTSESLADAIRRARGSKVEVGTAARSRVVEKYDLPALAAGLAAELERSNVTPVRRVVQVARHIAPGAGVPQVVHALEQSLDKKGIRSERIDLASTGIRLKTQVSRNPLDKLKLLLEVWWFSIAGTYAIRRARVRFPGAALLVHGDPIGGDVYVNHGLLKAVMRERRAAGGSRVPKNPMHWFTLARDRIRYQGSWQSRIVCLTEADEAILRQLYRVKSPVHVIPNGVDLESYATLDADLRLTTRNQLGLGDGPVALFVGHEFERKGLYIAIDALTGTDQSLRLLVVGGSLEMIERARTHAEEARVSHRVVFLGAQKDPRPYYAASDVIVLPSSYETGPLVLLEALAAGRMVVMTPTGLAPRLLDGSSNGQVVERSSAAIAAGIGSCLQALAADRPLIEAACRSSVEQHGWDAIADEYVALLARSVARKP